MKRTARQRQLAGARKGGAADTPAQRRARRRNAKRAGRPRRVCAHCGQPVKGGHKDPRLDASCGAHGWEWQTRNERRSQKGTR